MIAEPESRSASPQVPPRSSAAVVLIAYLAVTALLLPFGGFAPARVATLVGHLGTLVALIMLSRPANAPRATRWVVDWLPLALVPLLYWELPMLMEGLPGPVRYHDPAIVAIERAVFHGLPAYDWAGAMPWLALSELLHACYLSYYLLIYAPPLLVYVGAVRSLDDPGGKGDGDVSGAVRGLDSRGPRMTGGTVGGNSAAFRETVLAVLLAFLSCFLVFIVFPVQGPRYLGVPPGVPDGPVRRLVLDLLEAGSSRGAAFPSSHVSVSIAQALMALRHQPRVGRRILPIALGLAAGAVYGGFHYGIDALVGGAVGVAAASLAGPVRRRIEGRDAGFTRAEEAV